MTAVRTRCGFVAVVGLPNAGKSTLVNALVGSKVSIVSRKVQTTRGRILGIAMRGDAQIVLIDTPGIFDPKKTLEKAMVKTAWQSLKEADIAVHIIDACAKGALEDNKDIAGRLQKGSAILVLNKTDKAEKVGLLALAKALNDTGAYSATFMISALRKDGIEDLASHLAGHLPESPFFFPADQVSDMPQRLLAAEITREKIFDRLHEELPYSALVVTDHWEEFENGSAKIDQTIYVRRNSQKGIVLGKGGSKLKEIGQAARLELEQIFERRVHLKLHVKVEENWPERAEFYRMSGMNWPD